MRELINILETTRPSKKPKITVEDFRNKQPPVLEIGQWVRSNGNNYIINIDNFDDYSQSELVSYIKDLKFFEIVDIKKYRGRVYYMLQNYPLEFPGFESELYNETTEWAMTPKGNIINLTGNNRNNRNYSIGWYTTPEIYKAANQINIEWALSVQIHNYLDDVIDNRLTYAQLKKIKFVVDQVLNK